MQGARLFERLESVPCHAGDLYPVSCEDLTQPVQKQWVIVDEEYTHTLSPFFLRPYPRRGMSITTRVPRPGAESISTAPPTSAARSRIKPRP